VTLVRAPFPGTCKHCGQPIDEGEWVGKVGDLWCCKGCAAELGDLDELPDD
jgi:hypothetical protein